jgi:hypothetical protein
MTWHQQGTRRYFYRSVRIRGHPVRRYVGAGPAAELAAAVDELRRLERAIETRECRAEQERLAAAGAPLLQLCDLTDNLARATLLATGFHQHARSEWRRRRAATQTPADD